MTQRVFSLTSALVFSVIAFGHALRLFRASHITIDNAVVPLGLSWLGLAISAVLAGMGFWVSRTPPAATPTPKAISANERKAAENERETLQKLLFHVNNVFHTRVNFFLVAESIFLAAVATLWKESARRLPKRPASRRILKPPFFPLRAGRRLRCSSRRHSSNT
jgi:hypothetical protein